MRDELLIRYARAPEHPGKLRLVRWLGRTLVPDRGVVAHVSGGLRLYLHPRDWIEYLLLCGVPYEPLTLQFLAANLSPGDGAMLAGVNFGLHANVAASAVGPDGIVVGVEPQPAAVLRTRHNLELNGLLPRVLLVQAALGRCEQLVRMAWSNPDNAGAASLLNDGAGFSVPMLRLGSVRPLLGARRFRLLLLDVEGYEREVLAGLDAESRPEVVVIEVEPRFLTRLGFAGADLADILAAAGYTLFDLHGRPGPDLIELPEHNLVAVKKDADVNWRATN
jgi:FkbM family methyltransferase